MVTGGQTPGTAQLAPTASTGGVPSGIKHHELAGPRVHGGDLEGPAGQSLAGSRASMTLRRSASGMAGAASAQLPIRARARTGSRLVLMTHSSLPMMPQPIGAAGSGAGGASWAWYSASSSCPQADVGADHRAAADVPMITSAAARSMPSPASPAIRPDLPGNAGDTTAAQNQRASVHDSLLHTGRPARAQDLAHNLSAHHDSTDAGCILLMHRGVHSHQDTRQT